MPERNAKTLGADERIECDLIVVGSGAGGAMAAYVAQKAGLRVALLEAGPHLRTADFNQREEQMIPALFADAGGRATVDGAVTILQGRGVGGSTVHNTNLCKRAPAPVLARWGVDGWTAAALAPHYAAVEELLSVAPIPDADVNRNNQILRAGAEALGWKRARLAHNRQGCRGSGFCELGCAYNAKQNALKVLVPAALEAGCTLYSEVRADRIVVEAGRAVGVIARPLDSERRPGATLTFRGAVCLSGSAIGSAMLALGSALPDPDRAIGTTLRLHPGAAVAGVFNDRVLGWQGIPQSEECTELLDFEDEAANKRAWIVPAFAHPIGLASMLPGFGATHRETMALMPQMAVLTAMLHDESAGTVRVESDRLRVRYSLTDRDQRALVDGLAGCAEILFAAGAKRVLVPVAEPLWLEDRADVAKLRAHRYRPLDPLLTAVHPMGTLPLGKLVDPEGRYRHTKSLYVADGSLFPTSIGTPPQLSIYAAAHKVAGHIVSDLGHR